MRSIGRKECAGEPREQGPGAEAAEPAPRQGRRAPQPHQAEVGHAERVAGQVERRQQLRAELVPGVRERPESALPGPGVAALPEALPGLLEAAGEHGGRAVVEGVRQLNGRLDPAQSIPFEAQAGHEGRAHRQGVDGRADVVDEPGQRQLRRARRASHRVARLEELDGPAGPRQCDRRSHPFGPAPITTASRFMPLRGVQLQFQR